MRRYSLWRIESPSSSAHQWPSARCRVFSAASASPAVRARVSRVWRSGPGMSPAMINQPAARTHRFPDAFGPQAGKPALQP